MPLLLALHYVGDLAIAEGNVGAEPQTLSKKKQQEESGDYLCGTEALTIGERTHLE